MKKIFLFLILPGFASGCFAQTAIGDIFPFKPNQPRITPVTLIEGNYIRGWPFLDAEWRAGIVTLKNGNVFRQYKLRYDTYDQALMFLTDKDSLQATDPIREFSISDKDDVLHRFVNADEYTPQKKPLFYEVLLSGTKGQLLKVHHTLVKESGELSNAPAERQLYQSYEYCWYDRTTGQVRKLLFTRWSVKDALRLTDADIDKLSFNSYHFDDEDDLYHFFKDYLQ